jgi:hypothetical protein
MIIGRVLGSTRTLGKAQGYIPLPIRDDFLVDEHGNKTEVMVTAWEPTPEEIVRIAAGAPIHLIVCGTIHPPVRMEVGDVPTAT